MPLTHLDSLLVSLTSSILQYVPRLTRLYHWFILATSVDHSAFVHQKGAALQTGKSVVSLQFYQTPTLHHGLVHSCNDLSEFVSITTKHLGDSLGAGFHRGFIIRTFLWATHVGSVIKTLIFRNSWQCNTETQKSVLLHPPGHVGHRYLLG